MALRGRKYAVPVKPKVFTSECKVPGCTEPVRAYDTHEEALNGFQHHYVNAHMKPVPRGHSTRGARR